ncbi:hypothetical protein NUTIK01_22720 [Novosphingobium sp. IK01]|uniref:Uncharacterized protein n=1 Tax=Novosphingobium pituita TaxID=3056842 RepID=A0ABQ6P8C1_9SPHN|nr:hypothetical protein NUTIK01_22720 [Novosphingobium sp. IK01]
MLRLDRFPSLWLGITPTGRMDLAPVVFAPPRKPAMGGPSFDQMNGAASGSKKKTPFNAVA